MILTLASSCFKEDDPLPSFPMQTTTIEMGQYYLYQTYFSLPENKVLASNERNIYDLGFSVKDSAWRIYLNTATFMLAAKIYQAPLDEVADTTGLQWRFDKPDGNPDSTAIGNWLEISGQDTTYPNIVYVLNRGYDHLGNHRGLKKIAFSYVDLESYRFQYADLDGSHPGEFRVTKSGDGSLAYFSFDNGGQQLHLEPPKNTWDLLFTQYTTWVYTTLNEPYPYLVTGVLSNYEKIEMALDTLYDYEAMNLNLAKSANYTLARDFIGYDWKKLMGDINSGNVFYEIAPGRNYLIRSREGIYYKLRFTGFYNNQGEKGYPSFQYELL